MLLSSEATVNLNRRKLTIGTLGLGVSAALLGIWNSSPLIGIKDRILGKKFAVSPLEITASQESLLETIMNHLFPNSATSPGASAVQAHRYLLSMLELQRLSSFERKLLPQGLNDLEASCRAVHQRGFEQLSFDQKEACLRSFEQTSVGSTWLPVVLGYILEALLSDPVYGGNTRMIGWKWLGHKFGTPRPQVGKRYYEI